MRQRFHTLDVLRGGAALVVVLWHWRHFFPVFDPTKHPLYWLLWPFYLHGWRAVDLFFCISGFVFYWLYGDRIVRGSAGSEQQGEQGITFREFAVLRLSRLYPLHLATLFVVAIAQWSRPEPFVYGNNDLYHFGLQLFFASSWGLERGHSFNGPAWSISVEVAMYGLFWAACWLGLRRWWHLALFAAIGAALSSRHVVGQAAMSFFAGGLAFAAYRRIGPAVWPAAATGLLWVAVPLADHLGMRGLRFAYGLVLFPLTVLGFAAMEPFVAKTAKGLSALGDISYSSYLLHFPLQMLFASLVTSGDLFYRPATLGVFFLVLISVSLLSFRYFERPMQRWLRSRLSARLEGSNTVRLAKPQPHDAS